MQPVFCCDLEGDVIMEPEKLTKIVSSRSYLDGRWKERAKHRLFNEPELRKYFIPVNMKHWSLDVITTVDPGTIIPSHAHTETVYRLILDGTMELNGVMYEKWDWIIVPARLSYTIQTRTGYTVLGKYYQDCKQCTWAALSKMPLGKLAH